MNNGYKLYEYCDYDYFMHASLDLCSDEVINYLMKETPPNIEKHQVWINDLENLNLFTHHFKERYQEAIAILKQTEILSTPKQKQVYKSRS